MIPQPACGAFAPDGCTHRLGVRVYYEDTDFSGVVYHARYAHFFERGRSDFLRTCGVGHATLLEREEPVMFVVRRMSLEFESAARIDDALIVATRYRSINGARIEIEQEIRRAGERLAWASVQAVCVNEAGRARRAPAELVAAITPRLSQDGFG